VKRDALPESALAPAIAQMARLNDRAAAAMVKHGAHAATDVTGYGVVGHAGEMARASGVALAIEAAKVPLFEGVLELIARGIVPGGTTDNLADHAAFVEYAEGVDLWYRTALSDAQTSGGLLIAIPPAGAERVLAELADLGTVAVVGEVLAGPAGAVLIR
jgi:selenide,water dikinase